MESQYVVSLKKTEDGFSVWAPGLPGCCRRETRKPKRWTIFATLFVSIWRLPR